MTTNDNALSRLHLAGARGVSTKDFTDENDREEFIDAVEELRNSGYEIKDTDVTSDGGKRYLLVGSRNGREPKLAEVIDLRKDAAKPREYEPPEAA